RYRNTRSVERHIRMEFRRAVRFDQARGGVASQDQPPPNSRIAFAVADRHPVRLARGAAEDALDLLDRNLGRLWPSMCEVGGDSIAELSHRRSAHSVEQLAKAGRLVGSEDQLLENSHPSSAPAALSQRGTNEGLHVQVE